MIMSRAHSAILFGNTVTLAKNDFLNPNRLVAPSWTTDLAIHHALAAITSGLAKISLYFCCLEIAIACTDADFSRLE